MTGSRSGSANLHTVFTSECNNKQFDWFTVGVYESFRASGMQGSITRLLACSQEDLEHYKGLDLGPTFVHENHGRIPYSQTPNELGLPAGAKLPHGARTRILCPAAP